LVSRAAAHTTDRTDWRLRLEVLAKRKSITPADAGQQQNYLFEQYARTLRSLAQQRPLLLEIEDLHWADPGSCSLLSYLGRAISGSRIVVVGTYRPTEAGILRDGQRHPLKTVLHEFKRRFGDLELNLDRETTPEFMSALLDIEPNCLGSRFRESLYRQTKGHPLFTVELLRAMQERGMLARDESGRWVEGTTIDWDTLPAQVEGVIEERVGRLPDGVRKVLDLASVQGEEFIAEVLADPQGMSGREMVTLLSNELDKRHGLITAQRVSRLGGRRVSRYRFRHILFQKYLYGRMDEVERTYFHEEAGYALEAPTPITHRRSRSSWHGILTKPRSPRRLSRISCRRDSEPPRCRPTRKRSGTSRRGWNAWTRSRMTSNARSWSWGSSWRSVGR